jgi:hypothetical protein
MSDTDLAKRVHELEERVAYLERELDMSVDEQKWERQVKRLVPNGNDYEIDTDGIGYFTATVRVLPGDLPYIVQRIEELDEVGWQVEEWDEDAITIAVKQGLIQQ